MKKRILSILLCCVMLAGMLPSVAFAEGGTGSLTVTIDGFQVDNTPNDCTYTFSSTIPGVTFSADDIQYISWEKYAADDDLYPMNNTDVFRIDTRYRCVIQLDNNGLTEVPAVTVNGNTPDYCTLPYFGGVAQALSIGCDIGTPQVNPALLEQFPGLTPGETYWFDLSGADIPGNKNGSLPDDSLHWVPFTYVGTVSAYVLKSRSANDNTARRDAANAAGSTDPSNPIGYTYDHSLFIADYNVTSSSNWNNLNGRNLIFGTAYTSGGVDYTLRAPSTGSNGTASGGTPASNEWDAILDKANQSYQDNTVGYIKNWNGMESWGQDTQDGPDPDWNRATRGSITARSWQFDLKLSPSVGFRPVLELPSSDTLGSDGLATVTLDLNGGSIGSITGTINFAVKSDFNLTLPGGTDVTRPDGNDGTYFMWQDSSGNLYEPGAQVSANVGRLTALWKDSINPVITGLENDKTYCDTVEFEVSDNDGIASVTAGNEVLTAGSSGKYTLAAGVGTVTVVVTDKADNETSVTVTVNNGHTASNDDGDCSTPVYCIYHPNTVVVEAKSHDFSGEWNKDENGHWHTCQNDGCTVAEPKTPHSGTDDGDCTTAVICECGYTITAANADHTYGAWQSNGDGTHTRYCTVTGCNGSEDGDCDGGEATYFNKAICDTCHAEYGALLTDSTAPTGEISIDANKWNSFLNTITFGLFFKDTQSVTVTATDDSYSHAGYTDDKAVKVEYYLYSGDTALTQTDLASKVFTVSNGGFNINPDNKYVVYARLTDHAGNITYISSEGVVLDASAPVISGVENGKTYCEAQTVTVTEEYIESVKVNGTAVTLDANNQFVLNPADGTQTIVVTDKAGNETSVTVTVNNGHTYEWQSENSQYWKKCKFCGDKTAKKDIPTITINGADTVCITQDYKFSFTLPEGTTDAESGYEFTNKGGGIKLTAENGMYSGVLESQFYDENEISFKLKAYAKTTDGFVFSAEKTVAIQNEHAGGVATCIDLAICDTCGEPYGELDSTNHNLEKISAKDATVTATGNKEYWHCLDCGKYFADQNGENEIALADTVIAKLPPEIIEGEGQSVTEGEKKELTFRSNAAFGDFIRAQLDGKNLDEKNYTAAEGSTVVTLKADYVSTLSAGEHTIGIVSESGTATTTFTVHAKAVVNDDKANPAADNDTADNDTKSPQTGDNSHMALWLAVLLVSGGAVFGTAIVRKKKKHSKH